MNRIYSLVIFLSLSNISYSQPYANRIFGNWRSKESNNKILVRQLIFNKDSTYTESSNGSLGTINFGSYYYFIDKNTIVIEGLDTVKSKIVFIGNNKFKFSILDRDSAQDLMYMLTFKREK